MKILFPLLLASALGFFCANAPAAPKQPNIVLILSDDMGFSDLGCYGGEIQTPTLDSLAAGGVRFTQFYNTARCCPTRASLLTGLHPHQAGIGHMMSDGGRDGYRGVLNDRCVTIAEALRPAGYRTYMCGKWHVTRHIKPQADNSAWPIQRGFEKFYGTLAGAGSYYDPATLCRQNTHITPENDPEYRPARFYYTDALSDNAVRYLRQHAEESPDQPFFLYLAYTAAHWPMQALEQDIAKYKGRYDAGYEAVRQARFERMKKYGLIRPDAELSPAPTQWASVKDKVWEARCMEVYAAMVDNMDHGIGRVVAQLKRNGTYDNTLILFLQDNGGCAEGTGRAANAPAPAGLQPLKFDRLQTASSPPMQTRDGRWVRTGPGVLPGLADTYVAYGKAWANVSNTPFREYKHWTHEGGISTPLIAHWPAGITVDRRGKLERQPGQLVDIMATCLEVANTTYPTTYHGREIKPLEGNSLLPAFAGQPLNRKKPLVWEHEGNRAIRDGQWKLTAKENQPWELYDIETDRSELHDLAPSQPERVKAMAAGWDAWAARADVLPLGAWRAKTSANAASPAHKPNIVVLLADDSGWGDYSFNGNQNLQTPNIDSLARSGAVLDRFFVCSVCAPTRAEFLTGRYHPRGGVRGVSTGQERLNLDEKTFADAFKAAGYATGAFGKWHNGSQWPYHPNARGFDEFYGFTSGHWGEYFNPPLEHNGRPVRGQGYIADDLTSHAIDFIERNRHQPFLCYVPFNIPHSPWAVPEEYWRRFRDKPITLRANAGVPEELAHTRCALAMVENLDWNVGRVLRCLNELKLADNTIVIYFSDNGPNSWRWNGGMKGRKGSTDEGGLRSTFFLRWPARIKAGLRVPQIAGAIDLLPTLSALANVPRLGDKPLDGRDLSPLLFGQTIDLPDRLLFSHQNGNVSARSQQFRFDQRGALFDMIADPGQTRNVAKDYPEAAAKFAEAVAAWRIGTLPSAKDDRPYPVGYQEFPRTPLPARDGIPHGGVKRSASAPNCSYFVHWNTTDDQMTWDIEVNTSGDYRVEILYTCPAADAGSTIELAFNGSQRTGKVIPGWDPPLYTNQDTVARPEGESQMKEFRILEFGAIHLEKGRGLLTLRALDIPGKTVMDVRQINLVLQK